MLPLRKTVCDYWFVIKTFFTRQIAESELQLRANVCEDLWVADECPSNLSAAFSESDPQSFRPRSSLLKTLLVHLAVQRCYPLQRKSGLKI
jgi:hypothetical protein